MREWSGRMGGDGTDGKTRQDRGVNGGVYSSGVMN
jgi:hypothetical protein